MSTVYPDDSPPQRGPPVARERVWIVLPLLITLLLYLPACFGAEWVVDDVPLIPRHKHPGDILGEWTTSTHLHAANRAGGYLWRPLTSSLYQVWGEVFGRTPTPFRLLNLLLHLLNTALVVAGGRRLGARPMIAALVATAWAVHPLLPDAVCWMADTYDLLGASFLLLGLLAATAKRLSLSVRVILSSLTFFAALLSKEASLSWLAALPLIVLVVQGLRPALVHGVALLGVGLVHGRWHTTVVGAFDTSAGDILARTPLDFLGLYTDYLRWPLSLPVRAGFTHLVVPGDAPLSPLGLLLLGLAPLLVVVGVRRDRRPPALLGAGIGVWAVMVAPGALAAMAFGQQASRYLYMPMMVAAPVLAASLPPLSARHLRALGVLTLVWCVAWAPRTWVRIHAWQDEASLYADELRSEPDNAFAQKEAGRLLVAKGESAAGLALWREALQHPPASSFVMDVQRERLLLAKAALRAGVPELAREQLDTFLAEEQRVGRPVDDSVLRLRASLPE